MKSIELQKISAVEYQLCGYLTRENIPLFLAKANYFDYGSPLTIDCAGVQEIDSAGLALLIDWLRSAKEQQGSLTFKQMPAQMQSILELSHLSQYFNHPTN